MYPHTTSPHIPTPNTQVDRIGQQLYNKLVGDWGLLRELRLLRNAFLMGVPVLHGFTQELFARLERVCVCVSVGEHGCWCVVLVMVVVNNGGCGVAVACVVVCVVVCSHACMQCTAVYVQSQHITTYHQHITTPSPTTSTAPFYYTIPLHNHYTG